MAVCVTWNNPEHTAICIQITSPSWAMGEMRAAIRETWALLDSVEHRVDIILDNRVENKPASGSLALSRWIIANRPRNMGTIFIVGAGNAVKALYRVVQSTSHLINMNLNVVFVDTLEELHQLMSAGRQ